MHQFENQQVAIGTENNPFGVQLEAPMSEHAKAHPIMKPFGGDDLLQYTHKTGG